MPENAAETVADQTQVDATTQAVTPPEEAASAAAETASQPSPDLAAELDKWKALSRKNEAAAKANAEKARQFDELQEANKSELQKLLDRAETAEKLAADLQAEKTRDEMARKVATTSGVPAELLVGDTEEEMRSYAEKLKAYRGPTPTAPPATIVSNADTAPANQVKQLTHADLKSMTPTQIVAADRAGQLDELKGVRK